MNILLNAIFIIFRRTPRVRKGMPLPPAQRTADILQFDRRALTDRRQTERRQGSEDLRNPPRNSVQVYSHPEEFLIDVERRRIKKSSLKE